MSNDNFFIERDDDGKKPIKKGGDPKTTMFEKNSKGKFEEPKTTVFSSTPSAKSSNKSSYEFSAPTEIIPTKPSNQIPSKPVNQGNTIQPQSKNTGHQPIFNSGKIVNKQKRRNSKGFLTGFLVSFSRDPNGEYWVLRQGKNTIGSARNNNIILQESNINDEHAMLNIRRSKKDNRLMFAIVDMCSDEGTLVNGEDIEFTTTELSSGDKIIIGGYELLLLSFDKDQQALTSNSSFNDDSQNSSMRWQDMDYAAGDFSDEDDKTRMTP